ncbi:MAG: GNAT family N-acetyltransferase [Anaerolineae bacterium]|nr:GNAT family N-acetyltransferase [Anaerolineae bacterium]
MSLEGEVVVLREERRDDLDFLRSLRNSMYTQAWSKALPPDFTAAMYEKRFEAREFSFDPDEARLVIVHKETGQRAGFIGFNWLERRMSATVGISVAVEFWGTGVAFDAQEVMLRFLFHQMGVRSVRLWTTSGNQPAMALATKSGFREAVRVREAIFKEGKLQDNVLMDLLREEYYAQHPELEDALPPLEGGAGGG